MEYVILDAYQKAKRQQTAADGPLVNYVKEIYAPFTDEEISVKMVELLTPAGTQAKVEIVYQTLEGLHASCPEHPGDWYFSGDYPTPGGTRLVNEAFIHYMEEEYLKSFRENGSRQKNMTNIWRRSKREVQKCQVLFSRMKEPLPGETQK